MIKFNKVKINEIFGNSLKINLIKINLRKFPYHNQETFLYSINFIVLKFNILIYNKKIKKKI